MKISSCVVFPIFVEVDVPEGSSRECVENLILDKAGYILETTGIKPVITECNPDLDSLPENGT